MKRRLKRLLIDFFGIVFIIFGVIGIFLPILQGIFFIIIGVYLLSLHSLWFSRKLKRVNHRFPRTGNFIDGIDRKVRKFFNL